MKQILLSLLILVATLASCSNDSFKIDGDITNLDGTTVKVVFRGDSGIIDSIVSVDKKGHFKFKGKSAQPVIVSLLNHSNHVLAMLVATNGDHLTVKGDAGKEMSIKVKGNRLNEDWQLFREEHAAFYTDANPSRLDAAIEKYVREHPTDMLSTVLLVADYSDYSDLEAVEKLFKAINTEVRPKSLTESLPIDPSGRKKSLMPRLMTLNLIKHGGGFEEIKLSDRVAILSMWANPQNDREKAKSQINGIRESSDNAINVIDILTESDTLRWHRTIAGEDWPHYWAPGGPLEQGIQLLGITSLPWYAVTDSTGLIVYSGPSFDIAGKKALSLIHKP